MRRIRQSYSAIDSERIMRYQTGASVCHMVMPMTVFIFVDKEMMMRDVKFFDYPAIYQRFEAEFDAAFKDVCSRGAFILQRDLEEFEEALAKFLGIKHVFGVADGTNAMVIGFRAIGIGAGDEVIISSHTYVATAAALHMVGAIAVPADIDKDNMLCPDSVTRKITARTKAIMPTQLNGRCANMGALQAIADKHNLLILEDSAQGLGARYKGQSAGSFGPFGTLSFYPAKLIGCFGDGGAVMTNDDVVAEKLKLWRDHGRDNDGKVVSWGTNARLDNLQAAFLKIRLDHYDEDVARRREIAKRYDEGLSSLTQLHLPPKPVDDGDHFDVYQNYELAAEDRDGLRSHLESQGVKTIIQWAGMPIHHFEELGYGKDKITDLERTDWFFERCLMLPIHMAMNDDDVEHVVENILNYYK